ncbi:MAG TPA: phospholipid carrier-dependent glycosyltransferase [Myxococcales bacterium]|jgi:4-amino-4-deoxy-L-arabinose transferase-like glycosyltransferase
MPPVEQPEAAPARPAPSPWDLAILSLAIAAGVFLRIFFLTGPVGSDDTRYLAFAERFVTFTPFTQLDHAAGRLLFLVLIGLPAKLGGHAIYAAFANVAYSLAASLLVAVFCWRTLGSRPAIVAAAAMAFNALDVVYSGTILPDTTIALFLVAAVIAFWWAQQEGDSRPRLRKVALSGALTCLAYMCKDPGILFLPVGAALLFVAPKERTWRERLLMPTVFVAAFAVVFALDATVYRLFTGHFTYKMLATAACHNEGREALTLGALLSQGWGNLWVALSKWALGGVLLPLAIGVPALIAAGALKRGWLAFSAAGLFFVAFIFFGTSSLSKLLLLPFQPRYLQPVIPLVAICLAVVASRFEARFGARRAWILPAALATLLLANDFRLMRDWSGTLYFSPAMKSLRTVVELLGKEQRPIHVDSYLLMHSRHFMRPESYAQLRPIPAEGPLPDGLYVVGFADLSGLSQERLDAISAMPVKLRLHQDWRPLNQHRQLRLRDEEGLVVRQKESP